MKRLSLALLFCFTPFIVEAGPLKIVTVSAPAINCVFNPSCTVTVEDTSENIPLSTGGTGFLQSRTYSATPGSPAAGFFVYEYRLDLRNALGPVTISCIDSMTFNFGPVISMLNYDDEAKPDQVFVVTGGGIGTIGLAAALQNDSIIKFKFAAPICEGGTPGRGDSSFFWGMVARTPPKFVIATLQESGGVTHKVKVRAPQ